MRQFIKIIAAAALIAAIELPAADFYDLHSRDFWRPAGEKVIFDFDKITASGQVMLRSREHIKIEENRTYNLKMIFSGNEFEETYVYVGFEPCDRKGASIPAYCWQSYNNTFTQVTRSAARGAYSFFVKDASNWTKNIYGCVVADAEKDFSDIPNSNLIANAVVSIQKKGDEWMIGLREPLRHKLEAGTNARQHAHGGYCYLGGARMKVPLDGELKIDKKIKGYAPFGHYSLQQWPKNSEYAYLIILIDWTGTETSTIITEASMTVE